ncbi:cupin domain-containing protein [Lichenihabitans sp. PAMC28606]|uniref:cupin domain-containing protein n=1 Tax=Lichenihabitans sp. PAMC28606 TaxID=2880932 RepID=UPI001D0BB024|nr:cupin domain-containing protein [Lichenihabitans sp. PAMC28606]UDL93752.1 cupin domain-containing protein [Lichenihabitans sp. PAMC28606]
MTETTDPVRPIRFDAGQQPDGQGTTTTKQLYADPTGHFQAGFWSSEPSRSEVTYAIDEICFVLEGTVRLTDAGGHAEIFRSGDSFVVPAGFKGTWENLEPVRKFYAIHKPATG